MAQPLKEDAPPDYSASTTGDKLPTYQEAMGHVGLGELTPKPDEQKPGFILRAVVVLCGSCLCSLCYLILAALPISSVVIGSVYLGKCGLQPKIPIFLIVLGGAGLLNTIIHLAKQCLKRVANRLGGEESNQGASRGGNCAESFIGLFLFVWIIVGSVWVFGNWSEFNHFKGNSFCADNYSFNNYTSSATNYISCCHPVAYLYSFSVLVLMYALPVCMCCVCLWFLCCLLCLAD